MTGAIVGVLLWALGLVGAGFLLGSGWMVYKLRMRGHDGEGEGK